MNQANSVPLEWFRHSEYDSGFYFRRHISDYHFGNGRASSGHLYRGMALELRKTKTKVITLANPVNQSKLEVITRSRHKARENVHARAT